MLFCFTKLELERMRVALCIPEGVRGQNQSVWSGLEGLCILLHRLAFPCHLCDLDLIFGHGKTELSITVNRVLILLYGQWSHLFTSIGHHRQHWLSGEKMEKAVQLFKGKAVHYLMGLCR